MLSLLGREETLKVSLHSLPYQFYKEYCRNVENPKGGRGTAHAVCKTVLGSPGMHQELIFDHGMNNSQLSPGF